MSTKKKKPSKKLAKAIKLHKKPVAGKTVFDPDPANISMASAMKQTDKSMGFLYKAIKAGKLAAFKVGRTTVFRQSDIDKLMAPVPFKPVAARGYSKNFGVKGINPANKAPKPAAAKAKAKKLSKPRGLKASVAKALSGMASAGVAESSSAGND